jgi:hypothetical protein
MHTQPELSPVVDAGDSLGFLLGLGKCRQEHPGQDCDNGDNYQQFDQCKGMAPDRPAAKANQTFHGMLWICGYDASIKEWFNSKSPESPEQIQYQVRVPAR